MKNRVKQLVILPLVFVGSCTGVLVAVTNFLLIQSTEPVASPPPPNFPLVVVTEDASGPRMWPLYHAEYDSFAQEHPEHTFLIPLEAEEELRANLASKVRASSQDAGFRSAYDVPWDADFDIEEAGPTEQVIRAMVIRDDDTENVGWYRANERTYWPQKHRYAFGPSLALLGGIFGLLAGVVMVAIVRRRWA